MTITDTSIEYINDQLDEFTELSKKIGDEKFLSHSFIKQKLGYPKCSKCNGSYIKIVSLKDGITDDISLSLKCELSCEEYMIKEIIE